jgi:hypothetical protein
VEHGEKAGAGSSSSHWAASSNRDSVRIVTGRFKVSDQGPDEKTYASNSTQHLKAEVHTHERKIVLVAADRSPAVLGGMDSPRATDENSNSAGVGVQN